MVIIHRIFRREFPLAARLIGAVPDGDTTRSTALAGYLADLLYFLHHHHAGEDDLLWPRLLDRAQPDAELIHRMQTQHEGVGARLHEVETRSAQWRDTADAATRDRLVAALGELWTGLSEHLGEEETRILPLAAEHLSAKEWNELGERGMASTPRNQRLRVLGMILEDTTPEEQVAFLRKIPVPARVAWRVAGRRQYQQWTQQIRVG
jgi:iron-sulfur cluster repair protein YtfE (RIC family)